MDAKKTIHFEIRFGESQYYAESLDLPVVTQGKTLDETARNLREAVALHLEGEDPAELGLAADPVIVITYEAGVVGAA
jgi:predicted RNase H-like HicB family nuclease